MKDREREREREKNCLRIIMHDSVLRIVTLWTDNSYDSVFAAKCMLHNCMCA